MHYLSMISDKPDMVFRLELMMRSVRLFSGNKPATFSVVVNGDSHRPLVGPPVLTERTFHNRYVSDNADVYDCPHHWTQHVPCRWFLPAKARSCVFIDVDVVACNDLASLHDLDADKVHGVSALFQAMEDAEWRSIGFQKHEMQNYLNFGMLVVPSEHLLPIGREMAAAVPRLLATSSPHSPQPSK